MQGSKEYFIIMREQQFNAMSPEERSQLLHIEVRESNEYDTHKDDPIYIGLHKAEKKAKKNKQEYLFNKRHKQK